MKTALVVSLGSFLFAGSALAASKYEYKPSPPAKTYSAPARTYSAPRAQENRRQEYKRQDRQNDYRRQDTYRAQQNRVVNDSIKKQNAEQQKKKTWAK